MGNPSSSARRSKIRWIRTFPVPEHVPRAPFLGNQPLTSQPVDLLCSRRSGAGSGGGMGQPGLGKLPGKCLGVDEAPGEAEPVSSLFLKLGPSEPFATPQQACLMETATRVCSPAYPKWLPDGFGLRRFLLQQILGPIPATLPISHCV